MSTEARGSSTVEHRLYAGAIAIFLFAAALTLACTRMMSGSMPMPGGWTMAVTWMRMPGQNRVMAAAMFTAMWLAMMIAMMLPSSLPMLITFRRAAIARCEPHVPTLVWMMAAAYFVVWTAFGVVAYLAGAAIASGAMKSVVISRSIPLAAGVALVAAGIYQLTPWKAACLSHCRHPLFLLAEHAKRKGWRGAVAIGFHHGFFCTGCCWALMLMQLVIGVMNLAAMIAVATVIALEKLTPYGPKLARIVGVASVAGGIWLIARGASAM